MSEPGVRVTRAGVQGGVWHGRAMRADGGDEPTPSLSAWHLEKPLEGVEVAAAKGKPGIWDVRVPIPAAILSDGVQTVLIRDDETGEIVESVTLVTGEPLEHDIRAEISLLRAELDMLKRAFRRHCVESEG